MVEIVAIRHSVSDYPNDALTDYGVSYAQARKKNFGGFSVAIASGKHRAQQTAAALGYSHFKIDDRFNELEIPGVNVGTAHEYVLGSHERYPSLVAATADILIAGLKSVASTEQGKVLIISHNLALSALLQALTGQIQSFDYLGGLQLTVSANQITLCK